jgi:hypothetical protein
VHGGLVGDAAIVGVDEAGVSVIESGWVWDASGCMDLSAGSNEMS